LHAGTAGVGNLCGEELIQALADGLSGNGDADREDGVGH